MVSAVELNVDIRVLKLDKDKLFSLMQLTVYEKFK